MNLQRFRNLNGWQSWLLAVVIVVAVLVVVGESVNLILVGVLIGTVLQAIVWAARRLYARSRESR